MFCAISGEPPSTPVISKKSGLIYEQRLILKYIQENGKDPITGDVLHEDDLLEIKASPQTVAPKPPTHSSIPSLLSALQNEIDASVLETFTLKKAYDNVRQELAHALYANDSANRVIARLLYERDEARTALASLQDSMGQNGTSTSMAAAGSRDAEMTDVNNSATTSASGSQGLAAGLTAKIDEISTTLSSTRKAKMKRKPEGYTQSAQVAKFAQIDSIPSMHTTRSPGVSALDVSFDGTYILTGGRDKQVQVYNKITRKTTAVLKGHSGAISKVLFVKSLVDVEFGNLSEKEESPQWAISAGIDQSVYIWKADEDGSGGFSIAHHIQDFSKSVTGIAVHPSGLLVIAASEDGSIGLYEVQSGERLAHISTSHQFTSLDIHPDGVLLAAGTSSGSIVIYDVRTGQESASFTSGSSTAVTSLNFSENGYLLASSNSSQVEIWDLRKLNKTGSIEIESTTDSKGSTIPTTVRFDPSAQFLALVGSDVRIYANKTWQLLWSSNESHSAPITDCRWTWDQGLLITSSLDRSIRTFGHQEKAQ